MIQHSILCTGKKSPVHGAAYLIAECTGEMTPAHWIASLYITQYYRQRSLQHWSRFSPLLTAFRVAHDYEPPSTCCHKFTSLHLQSNDPRVQITLCMLSHIIELARWHNNSLHACPMQIPCPEFCNIIILHVHQIQFMRICTHWGFPCMIQALPHVFSTANSLANAFATPLQRCSP